LNRGEFFVPDASLSVDRVTVRYGTGNNSVRAVQDVSVTFRPAELTLIMGPSGSGKTTLLSVLGCLRSPDAGSVTLMNQVVTGVSENVAGVLRRRYIGYVFQAFRLFHSLSALENVLIALQITGRRGQAANSAALHTLEVVGLGDKLHLRPEELSGGEKQRVALARVLVNDPPVVLADEPTASLDPAAAEQVASILRKMAEDRSRIVVVVSHDSRWREMSNRILTMKDGRLVDDSPAG
jgi:putative ABC transport system ATP-binding protein